MANKKPMTHTVDITKVVSFGVSRTWSIEVRELKKHWVNKYGDKYCKLNGSKVGDKYNAGRINFNTLKEIIKDIN